MKVALVCSYASFVETNMAIAFEKVAIESWIVKSNKPRFDYRRSPIRFEMHRKTIELPCLLDNRILGEYAPFPIMPHLLNTIRELDVDIVNVSEYVSLPTWLLSILKRKWKTVLTQHGYGKRQTIRDQVYEYLTRKFLIARINGFVGIGLRACQLLQRLGARIVAVIPNPIDDTLFRCILPYEEREDVVLYVGRTDTRRGLHSVLKAMRDVRQKIENAKLLIIGEEGNLTRHIPREGWVQYLGSKPHLEMPRYYNLAKVFVSAVPGEAGCGCALEEALACGTPVVGTTHLDFPFVWKDGEVGYVVNPDQTDLARGIIKILQGGSTLHAKCRETAVREFGHLSVGRRYREVFERILDR